MSYTDLDCMSGLMNLSTLRKQLLKEKEKIINVYDKYFTSISEYSKRSAFCIALGVVCVSKYCYDTSYNALCLAPSFMVAIYHLSYVRRLKGPDINECLKYIRQLEDRIDLVSQEPISYYYFTIDNLEEGFV